jgi:hypothetical protein
MGGAMPLDEPSGQSRSAPNMSTIDLVAYFSRIGFEGTPSATLTTLRRLQALHPV